MAMPASGQSRNSGSSRMVRKMCSVASLKAYCSMSKLTKARCCRAARRMGRSRSPTAERGPGPVERIELAEQGRQLDRHVDAGQLSEVIAIDEIDDRPGVDLHAQTLNDVQVRLLVALGFTFGDGRLAEQIDREGEPALPQPGHRLQGFFEIATAMNRRARR